MRKNSIRGRLMASTVVGGAALLAMAAVPAVALLAPTSALAQSQTGNLRVAVTGDDGQPLAGATVTVSSPDSLVSRTGVTDAEGRVRLGGLDPATNYTVRVTASGYDDYSASNVAVVSGRDLSLGYVLISGANSAATDVGDVIVTGRSLAAIDVTSATVGTTLTLDIVESLPTGRSYQSYLQLVPGVKPSETGNPASRSGVNYADYGGAVGQSTDNTYYLDGVDVTDPYTGTFGANFNSEIIQEQSVIVGGVPAEYAGGAGLVSRVVTKSGSNEWHGSVNYYLQNDDLVQADEHGQSNGFSTYDTAFTFGGPILQDRLWFFGSYQKRNREDEVVNPNTDELLRTAVNEGEYAFLKATWQITDEDRLTAVYFSDPSTISNSDDPTVLNNRDTAQAQGGVNYKIEYNRTLGDFLFNAYAFKHEGELSLLAADKTTRNTIAFQGPATNAQRFLGGYGADLETFRNRDEFGFNGEYFLDTSFGSHTLKAGYSSTKNVYEEASTIPGGANYTSIALGMTGATFGSIVNDAGWTSRPFSNDDRARIITAVSRSSDRDYYMGILDANDDGTLSSDEVSAIQFTSTAGNPNGQINAFRTARTRIAPYDVTTEGKAFYVQDTWTLNQLTLNAGVRAEQWKHIDSNGNELFTFDWEFAPRLSVVYDVFGDGRSKVFGFAGRYYDPLRTDRADFAGALSGPVDEEQIFLGDRWLTYRTRGGTVVLDSVFSPTTKTPYTDEFMIGGSTTLRSDVQLSASVVHRRTRDIFEDFDLAVYSNPNGNPLEGQANEDSPFYIPLSYFGFDEQPEGVNYVLGTLPGGKRDYTGFEVTLQKFRTDNWQGMVSYTYNNAEGNTSSDGSADFAGDVIWLDPRAPNVWAETPGNIRHQFKAFGSYLFDFGLEVSGVFNWNSGVAYTAANASYSRYLPQQVEDAYEYGGVTTNWLLPGAISGETGPSYYTFDARFKYVLDLPVGETELFLDVFNVLNNQAAISEQSLLAGDGVYLFGEANDWVAPRRAYLGVRYSF